MPISVDQIFAALQATLNYAGLLLACTLIFWMFWYLNVQCDRFFSSRWNRSFEMEMKIVDDWYAKPRDWLHTAGVVFYAPYKCPVISLALWIAVMAVAILMIAST